MIDHLQHAAIRLLVTIPEPSFVQYSVSAFLLLSRPLFSLVTVKAEVCG